MWNADPRQQWDFVFLETRGYPLPVNSEVLDTLNFDVDTTRETLAKNDQNVDAFVSKLCDIRGPDVTQFWYN